MVDNDTQRTYLFETNMEIFAVHYFSSLITIIIIPYVTKQLFDDLSVTSTAYNMLFIHLFLFYQSLFI